MEEIFLSYSRKDAEGVDKLKLRLDELGYSVWFDQEDIKAGGLWRSQIVEGIERCRLFIIVLTAHSVASDNVRRELDLARTKNKSILPLLMEPEPIRISKDMEYQLVGLQRVSSSILFTENAKRLLENLTEVQPTAIMPIPEVSAIGILKHDFGSLIPLTRKKYCIGRGPKADLDLTQWDRNRYVSKEHAELVFRDEKWQITASVSANNPTRVNGRTISSDHFVELNEGDEIVFADVRFRFTLKEYQNL